MRRKAAESWLSGEGDADIVRMPHCWNRAETFIDGVDVYHGWGSYRTSLDLTEVPRSRSWIFRAGSFRGTGDLWVNGSCVRKVDGAYLGFDCDITPFVRSGECNTVALRITNRCSSDVLPGIQDPDFVLYGGAAGGLWIEERSQSSVEVSSIHVRDPLGAQPSVQIGCMLSGVAGSDISHEVFVSILDSCDRLVTSTTSLSCGSVRPHDPVLHAQLAVPDPKRWSPAKPDLYCVQVELHCNGEIVDTVRRSFGIRKVEFRRGEGFYLNEEQVKLRGCNRHESIPGWGNALTASLNRRDAELIASMGLNFVRLAHYPQSPDFLDACDELGILVYAEVASWKSVRKGRWLDNAQMQLTGMIQRDHHHPSIILWGLGNESRDLTVFRRLREVANAHDPEQRAVIYAENHLYRARRSKTLGVTDVWGSNYELDELTEGTRHSRLGVGLLSECANTPHAKRGQTCYELEQLNTIQTVLSGVEAAGNACAGYAIWSFNDYATLRKRRIRRECGLVDAFRSKKLAGHWHGACNSNAGDLILEVRVDWAEKGTNVRRVMVVTNGDAIEIKAGGNRVIPTASYADSVYVADMPFCDQPLVVEARAARQRIVHTVYPWGPPADLMLAPQGIESLGDDVFAIHVEVCDADSRAVRLFEGEGVVIPGEGVDLYCVGGNQVWFRGGKGIIYLRRRGERPLSLKVNYAELTPLVIEE